MANQPRTRTVTRLSLVLEHIVETYPSAPPFPAARKIITTTGEAVEELPPSQPSIRAARPANVVQFPVRRTGTRGMTTLQALALAAVVAVVGVASATYAASLRSEPSMGAP